MMSRIDIVVAILKMTTGRNFSMSGINSGHHNLPTYEMSLKSDNVYLVYLLIRSILFTTINKVEIGKICNIMKTNTTLSEQFQAPVEKS
jgi:hypothetical protein